MGGNKLDDPAPTPAPLPDKEDDGVWSWSSCSHDGLLLHRHCPLPPSFLLPLGQQDQQDGSGQLEDIITCTTLQYI